MIDILGLLALALAGIILIPMLGGDEETNETDAQEPDADTAPRPEMGDLLNPDDFNAVFDGTGEDSDDRKDQLLGTEGRDLMITGQGDVAWGDDGHDVFVAFAGEHAFLQDFSQDDTLLIVHDADDPVIEYDASDQGTDIYANGQLVASLRDFYQPVAQLYTMQTTDFEATWPRTQI